MAIFILLELLLNDLKFLNFMYYIIYIIRL